jgi:hypothetical protein
MRFLAWATLLAVLLTSRLAAAPICEHPAASRNDSYSYLVSYIAASIQLQHACELALQNGLPPMGENIGDTLLQLKRAKQALACATEILSPYTHSTNELIKLSSVLATKGVETLSGGANKEIQLYKRVLDATSPLTANQRPLATSQFADELSDIGVQEDSGWELLTKATQGAFYAAVDQGRMNVAKGSGSDDWRRLLISSDQRRQLLASLEQSFGQSVKHGVVAQAENQTSVQTAAAFLYQALSEPAWKARDE